MPEIIVTTPFKFAHHGHQVEDFQPSSEPRKTTDECTAVALQQGWDHLVGAQPPAGADPAAPETAAAAAAPENRDAAATRRARKTA